MKLGIQAKTIIPVTLILVVAMTLSALFNYTSQVAQVKNNARLVLEKAVHTTFNSLDSQLKVYEQMAAFVANMPLTAHYFKEYDRQGLLQEFEPSFQILKKDFGLAQFQFHIPPATSFLRVHSPEKYGDDLSGFRKLVLQVNKSRKAVAGIEIGRAGIGLRGVQPVFYGQEHIGSIEFGGNLAPALEETRKIFNVDLCVTISGKEATQIWKEEAVNRRERIGAYIPFYTSNPELTRGILNNSLLTAAEQTTQNIHIERVPFGRKEYYVATAPLRDYSGTDIGFVHIFMDATATLAELNRILVTNIAGYIAILLLVSLAILFSLKKSVIDHLISLTKAADAVSMGELDNKVALQTHDELATLAKSIDRLRMSMKKLLE